METKVKERPILMAGDMVQSLLEGRKRQTRRAMAPQPHVERGVHFYMYRKHQGVGCRNPPCDSWLDHCRYGRPGDSLWVRETWRPSVEHNHAGSGSCECEDVTVYYDADDSEIYFPGSEVPHSWTMPKSAERGNVPNIFMPRWASRITLDITDMRVQRLQDISDADCLAEGIYRSAGRYKWLGSMASYPTPRDAFRALIESHGRKNNWEANVWVWAITFKVREPQ